MTPVAGFAYGIRTMAARPDVCVLEFVSGKYKGDEFALAGVKGTVAGRSSEADLVLADDTVSRRHAKFFPARGRTWVRDLGSRNGTVVNGERVDLHCLRAGDRIAIGSSLLRVSVREPSSIKRTTRAGERREAGGAMSGSLEDIPLVDVLQWLATSRKTGTVKVQGGESGRAGELRLREGSVFYAAIEGREEIHPEKALIRMLGWRRGKFALDSETASDSPVQIEQALEHMLMEAARQQDELARLEKDTELPQPGDAVHLVYPSPSPWRALEPDQLDMVQALAEGRTFWEILDTSTSDDLTVFRTYAALRKRGVVAVA